jgi:hypothetical protein
VPGTKRERCRGVWEVRWYLVGFSLLCGAIAGGAMPGQASAAPHGSGQSSIPGVTSRGVVATASPYGGTAWLVPGSIQAEDFDIGGEGVAYHDTDAVNSGGVYRSTGVDVQATGDSGGGYNVGWVKAGEWLTYTVNVASTGSYDFQERVGSDGQGGAFHVEVDGADKTGAITIPGTGGWQLYQTLQQNSVGLNAGVHVLRISADSDGNSGYTGNFNWLRLVTSTSIMEPFKARYEFNQLLEPTGAVLHGAGQVITTLNMGGNYTTYVPYTDATSRPVIASEYAGLGVHADWSKLFSSWQSKYDQYSWYIVPLIGIGLGGTSTWDDVSAGKLDSDLQNMTDALKAWGKPAYIRPGFEFNGPWSEAYADPTAYKEGFIRIYNKIHQAGLTNVALVWDYSADGSSNYMNWYPGDAYVDWWGINAWSNAQFTSTTTRAFLDAAASHRKPVFVPETAPRYMSTVNVSTWNDWFVPFYNFIRREPTIKAFAYIDWNWALCDCWATWGDSRIGNNATINANLRMEMHTPGYFNASSEAAYDSIVRH